MIDPNLPDPTLITQATQLRWLVPALRHEPVIAVDTESNSLYAYRERVCLIQISTPQADYLVDPIVLEDLSMLGPVFTDPEVEKVFHAAEYDLLCLKRDFGFQVNNLFDTMVAAKILGRQEVGLGKILLAEFGVQLEKRHQRANWGQRPLPDHLLSYARLDTHYLIHLRNQLQAALVSNGRWPLAQEDFVRACQVDLQSPGNKNNNCWAIQGARDLKPRQAAVLQELCQYRSRVAAGRDVPVFRVMHNRLLLALAEASPGSMEGLRQVEGMNAKLIRQHGKPVLAAIERGKRAKPIHPPRYPRQNERYLNRLDLLRRWRRKTARKLGVGSDVILPRDLMQLVAKKNPQNLQELSILFQDVPWRLEHYGEQVVSVLRV